MPQHRQDPGRAARRAARGWRAVARAAFALLAVAPVAHASLQPPVLPDEPEETLLAVGGGLYGALALDARGQPHVVFGGTQGDAPPLRHAWFDGLVWRLRTIAPDRLGLRDFIDLTAEQWFAALPGPPPLFTDGFESAPR